MSLISRQLSLALGRIAALGAERGVRRRITSSGRELRQAEAVLFFSEPPGQAYQLEAWLAPFERLAASGMSVGIVVMNALSAQRMLGQSSLPVFYSRSMEQVERRLREAGTRAICYVNNASGNFTMLRFNGPRHIHLNHGESEKSSMVSNQLKAYDQVAVAGPAAIERIEKAIARFDTSRLVPIGRPQLDAVHPVDNTTGRVRVLYAPTWEGDSRAMGYSSLRSRGSAILEQLAADARIELRFRPHPKTGDTSSSMKRLITALRRRFAANLDPIGDPGQSLAECDVAICDISAMAYDALALNVPLLAIGTEECELTRRLPDEQRLDETTDLAERVLALAAAGTTAQQDLARYFFATTEPGEATKLLGELIAGH